MFRTFGAEEVRILEDIETTSPHIFNPMESGFSRLAGAISDL
jgi:hypothetical protein